MKILPFQYYAILVYRGSRDDYEEYAQYELEKVYGPFMGENIYNELEIIKNSQEYLEPFYDFRIEKLIPSKS